MNWSAVTVVQVSEFNPVIAVVLSKGVVMLAVALMVDAVMLVALIDGVDMLEVALTVDAVTLVVLSDGVEMLEDALMDGAVRLEVAFTVVVLIVGAMTFVDKLMAFATRSPLTDNFDDGAYVPMPTLPPTKYASEKFFLNVILLSTYVDRLTTEFADTSLTFSRG